MKEKLITNKQANVSEDNNKFDNPFLHRQLIDNDIIEVVNQNLRKKIKNT